MKSSSLKLNRCFFCKTVLGTTLKCKRGGLVEKVIACHRNEATPVGEALRKKKANFLTLAEGIPCLMSQLKIVHCDFRKLG